MSAMLAISTSIAFAREPLATHKSLSRLKAGLISVRDSLGKAQDRLDALKRREKVLNDKMTDEIRPLGIPSIDKGFQVVRNEVSALESSSAKALHTKLLGLLKQGYVKTLSLVVSSRHHNAELLSAEDIHDGLMEFKSKDQFLATLKKVEDANEPFNPRSFEIAQTEIDKIKVERKALLKKVKKCEADEQMILNEIRVVSSQATEDPVEEKSTEFAKPVPGKITSGFGPRMHPVDNLEKDHKGVDFAAKEGDEVKAAAEGTVIFAGVQNGYGNLVILQHANGMTTRYAHLSEIGVGIGETITKGSVLGKVGMTGNATGPHLHFEIRENDIPVDPQKYL